MKKTAIYYFSLAALAAGSFASCQDYNPIDEDTLQAITAEKNLEKTFAEYALNFEKQYGKTDPNHKWGFKELKAMSFSSNQTRAGAGAGTGAGVVDVNRNQWTEVDNNGYKESALAKSIDIPGWPNFDSRYYTVGSNGGVLKSIESTRPTDAGSYQAAGDVTEYEIQYVSNWFRTNRWPRTNVELHLSDFFIQNVSSDFDQKNYPIGENITNTKQGGSNITDNTTSGQNINYDLDFLCFKPIGASNFPTVDDTWTHVNNFNAGNSNKDPENHTYNNPYREIKYIYSSGTEDFACRPSWGTEEENAGDFINCWVLVKLDWNEVGADGKSYHREGYYLAFDYEAKKEGTEIHQDGYYSNWIVKITPAHFKEVETTTRVMCEDLGNVYDFDFNDVVFDVAFHRTAGNRDGDENARFDAVINLQAAGGTMPIYVGMNPTIGENAPYEAHALLGHDSSTPVNVDAAGNASHEVATYRIPNLTTKNAGDIKIWVKNGNTYLEVTGIRGNLDKYDSVQYEGNSNVPERFAVPTSVMWMNELKFIETGYPQFKAWAQDENENKEWYSNPSSTPGLIHAAPVKNQQVTNGNGGALGSLSQYDSYKVETTTYNEKTAITKESLSSLIENKSTLTITIVYDNVSTGGFSGTLYKVPDSGNPYSIASPSTPQLATGRYTLQFNVKVSDLGEDFTHLYLSGDNLPVAGTWYVKAQ